MYVFLNTDYYTSVIICAIELLLRQSPAVKLITKVFIYTVDYS